MLQGDPVASYDVAAAYLEPLARAVGYARDDEHDRWEAAEDALMAYLKAPEKYNPARAPLATYLRMAARSDLKNLQAKASRHARHTARIEAVELSPEHRNSLHDNESNPENQAIALETVREQAQRRAVPGAVVDELTPEERKALALMSAGERRTPFYVEALGIANLDPEEQRKAVKQVKDRLKARIKRAGGSLG